MYEEIARNLNVSASTVWRVVKQFLQQSSVTAGKNRGRSKIGNAEQFVILEWVLQTPSIYLRKVQSRVEDRTGNVVTESAICRYLQRSNFSRKKLNYIAAQRS